MAKIHRPDDTRPEHRFPDGQHPGDVYTGLGKEDSAWLIEHAGALDRAGCGARKSADPERIADQKRYEADMDRHPSLSRHSSRRLHPVVLGPENDDMDDDSDEDGHRIEPPKHSGEGDWGPTELPVVPDQEGDPVAEYP